MKELTISAVRGGEEKSICVPEGQNLLKSLRDMGFSLRALCGERGSCGSCRARVTRGALPPSGADKAFFSEADLEAGWRLSCTAYPTDDLCLELTSPAEDDFSGVVAFQLPETGAAPLQVERWEATKSKDSIVRQVDGGAELGLPLLQAAGRLAAKGEQSFHISRYGGKIVRISESPENLYAVGVDIGTTTIGMALVDLQSTAVIGRFSAVNRQRDYGADVVTRIVRAKGGDLPLLQQTVKDQLAEGITNLCRDHGVRPASVVRVAVAGNTTMLHLFLGLSCDLLGKYPFTPVTLDKLTIPWRELFGGELSCDVDILPGISTYVGADITAGLLYLMLHKSERPGILLDIGTNGEMALAMDGKLLCTSTAAGPALEGGNIAFGTGSIPGAISSVRCVDGGFEVTTIGGKAPVGICGSGVIEAIHTFLEHGILNKTGRFQGDLASTGAKIAKTDRGEEIYISQKDVREVQLAKGAIRAGLEVLIRRAGLRYDEIGTLYIAGGFGFHINFRSGVGIGLVPAALEDKIKIVGNSSLGGLVSYLVDPEKGADMDDVIRAASEFSLSEDEDFDELFIRHMSF